MSDTVVQFLPDSPSSLGPRGDYVKDLTTGALTLVLAATEGSSASFSADGRRMAFSRIVAGSYDRRVFVRDLSTGQEQLVSAAAGGLVGNGNASAHLISRDGSSVAFHSNATNLVSPATPANTFQVYLKTTTAVTQ